jgi:hypothetical protein
MCYFRFATPAQGNEKNPQKRTEFFNGEGDRVRKPEFSRFFHTGNKCSVPHSSLLLA